ncbi:AI-2E family transporter [Nesterenkonia muleiensis]|uniref:AI-2E family transporter n=1 Tax=Nesterenkonia muleiensis TaxID=2282648 RepID=UPI000E70EFC9|nr:AI-2E family transporter [Nesterenkonia muleiensis]
MSTGSTPENTSESVTTDVADPAPAEEYAPEGGEQLLPSAKELDDQRLREDIPWGVRIAAEWSWRIIIILIALGVLVWLLSHIMLILISLAIAGLLATLLRPLFALFRKIKFPRILASMTSILVFLAVVVGILTLVGNEIVSGFAEMAEDVQDGIYETINWADQTLRNFGLEVSTEEFNQWIDEVVTWVEDNSEAIMSGAVGVGSVAGNIAVGSILVLFTLIFFLSDGPKIWDFLVLFVPAKHRPAIHGAGRRGWTSVGTYMRVQVFVAFVDAVGIGLGAWILDIPLALPIAVLVFFGGFVPIVGAVVTGAVAVLLALVAHDFLTALLMLGVVLLVQQLESNVLQPIVMGKAVKLHPLAVVIAVTAGTTLLGIVGALFAVPVLAFINRVTQYLNKEEWRNDQRALDMERTVKEEALRRAAHKEKIEADEQASIASLRHRLFETIPGLNPERRSFGRPRSDETEGASEQTPAPVPAMEQDRKDPDSGPQDEDKDVTKND